MLEQYYLLQSAYNLNSVRVSNNPSGSNARALYMYNRDKRILYFASAQQVDFIKLLAIHHTTFTKHLEKGRYYLGKYLFRRDLLLTATPANINEIELINQLRIDRIKFNKIKPVNSLSKFICLEKENGKRLFFDSLGKCVTYLKRQGHKADQRTLVKRINTNIIYYGYNCKSSS